MARGEDGGGPKFAITWTRTHERAGERGAARVHRDRPADLHGGRGDAGRDRLARHPAAGAPGAPHRSDAGHPRRATPPPLLPLYRGRAGERRKAHTLSRAAASAATQDAQMGIDQPSTWIAQPWAARQACATATTAKTPPETTSYVLTIAGSPLDGTIVHQAPRSVPPGPGGSGGRDVPDGDMLLLTIGRTLEDLEALATSRSPFAARTAHMLALGRGFRGSAPRPPRRGRHGRMAWAALAAAVVFTA